MDFIEARFGVASGSTVDRYCIRDADSRLIVQEKAAVDEWVKSGRKFNVMRDHPSHTNNPMRGGMWCGTRDALLLIVRKIREADHSRKTEDGKCPSFKQ